MDGDAFSSPKKQRMQGGKPGLSATVLLLNEKLEKKEVGRMKAMQGEVIYLLILQERWTQLTTQRFIRKQMKHRCPLYLDGNGTNPARHHPKNGGKEVEQGRCLDSRAAMMAFQSEPSCTSPFVIVLGPPGDPNAKSLSCSCRFSN